MSMATPSLFISPQRYVWPKECVPSLHALKKGPGLKTGLFLTRLFILIKVLGNGHIF